MHSPCTTRCGTDGTRLTSIRTLANQLFLTYDTDLESVALAKALNCTYAHSLQAWRAQQYASLQNRSVNTSNLLLNETVGENLAARGSAVNSSVAINLLTEWFDERHGWNCKTGSCSKATCLHFTQVVNYLTTGVGCAAAICPPATSMDDECCYYFRSIFAC